jgi:hypothetical protein
LRATASFAAEETTAIVRAPALGDLEGGGADAAGRAVHEHGLAGLQPSPQLQGEQGGVVVEEQRGALGEVERLGQREGQRGRRHRPLGEPAEQGEGGDAIPDRHVGARRGREDHPRHFRPGTNGRSGLYW